MVKRIAALGLALALQMAAPWQAHAATTPADAPSGLTLAGTQMSMPMPAATAATQASGTSVGKSMALGAGAVIGYTLMLSPVGSAIMGAAMGAMLAMTAYDAYWTPEAPATPPK